MKQVVLCVGGCNKVVRLYGSYKVHIKERVKVLLTGEVREVEYEGRICRACAEEAGYKVHQKAE